ncbi:hypothetical protein V8C40DRAFT_9529 [Trichoderma camerunense]
MDWSNRKRHAQGLYSTVPLFLSFVLFAWPLVGCSASCVYRMLRCVVCCCCCYSVLCVVRCCVALRYVALPCPALLAPWLAMMHSALQLCYHRARRRFNASNCRMCMRRPQTKVLGVQVGATRTRDKEKERNESVCVCVCVCGRARHRDSQQSASQVGVEIHDANASCDSFG